MTPSTVIFVFTNEDVQFGIQYRKSHPGESIHFLAPNLEQQLLLRENNLKFDEYFISHHFTKEYYSKHLKNKENFAVETARKIISVLALNIPSFSKYFSSYQCWIEIICIEVYEAYLLNFQIKKKWKPRKYLLNERYKNNKFSIHAADQGIAAFICKYFAGESEAIYFNYKSSRQHMVMLNKGVKQIISHFPIRILHDLQKLFNSLVPNKNDDVDVVFISGGRNLYFNRDILRYLSKFGINVRIVSSKNNSEDEQLLKENNIEFVSIEDYTTLGAQYESSSISKVFKQVFIQSKLNIESNIGVYKNIKVARAINNEVSQLILDKAASVLEQHYLAARIINIHKPKLLITTHDPSPSALPFVIEAKAMNVKTLVLMHGWQNTIMGVDFQSDYIAVWSDYIKRWYISRLGKKAKSILSLGYPHFDELFNGKLGFWQKPPSKSADVEFISPTIRIGLLMTMYFPTYSMQTKFLDDLLKHLSQNVGRYCLSIRAHPGQSILGIEKLAAIYNYCVAIDQNGSLEDFIDQNDVIVSWDTTALLWVMLSGKPLFYCTPSWGNGISDIEVLVPGLKVSGASELMQKVNSYKNINQCAKIQKLEMYYLKKVVEILDPTSSIRHAQKVKELVNM